MGRKVFVSYKHGDNSVQGGTARDYVDYLSENTLKNDVYKGEYNEDLSAFKDDTIKNRLKDKIHDSSVTLVLVFEIIYRLELHKNYRIYKCLL
jgi:hypothetical protein